VRHDQSCRSTTVSLHICTEYLYNVFNIWIWKFETMWRYKHSFFDWKSYLSPQVKFLIVWICAGSGSPRILQNALSAFLASGQELKYFVVISDKNNITIYNCVHSYNMYRYLKSLQKINVWDFGTSWRGFFKNSLPAWIFIWMFSKLFLTFWSWKKYLFKSIQSFWLAK